MVTAAKASEHVNERLTVNGEPVAVEIKPDESKNESLYIKRAGQPERNGGVITQRRTNDGKINTKGISNAGLEFANLEHTSNNGDGKGPASFKVEVLDETPVRLEASIVTPDGVVEDAGISRETRDKHIVSTVKGVREEMSELRGTRKVAEEQITADAADRLTS